MYIRPETNIKILHNVPLDNTYDHSIYFSDATSQYNYFVGLVKYNLTEYTYQRVNKGVARVGYKADDLYDCNYMMFQNTSYGNKWFYAFITKVEYINNTTSDVFFEMDVLQTWYFDWEFEQCFIERETTPTDEIGEHIEPEPVELGEYVFNDYSELTPELKPMCVVVATADSSTTPIGNVYDGVYGGCKLKVFNVNTAEQRQYIYSYLYAFRTHPDEIVDMYMAPVVAAGGTVIADTGEVLEYSKGGTTLTHSSDAIKKGDSIDGYVPNNNKLYTYPYNFFEISNASNSSLQLRYEFFSNLKPVYKINVPITRPLECVLRPYNYKNSGATLNTNESINLSNYPSCSWNMDSYIAWLSQNSIPNAVSIGTSAVNAGLMIAGSQSPLGAAYGMASLVNAVASKKVESYRASIASDIYRGNFNSGNANVSAGTQSFYGGRMSVTQQYAKMIDGFFTRFGYNVRHLGKPYLNNRPHWTYMQTSGCTIKGSIPADDMSSICKVFDNGITFWMNGDEIGNYSLNNAPEP